jgi:hypothetical protein
MDPEKNTVSKLQSLPYATRVKILWGTVLIVGIVMVLLIAQSIKSSVNNVDGSLIKIDDTKATSTSPIDYASVERVESDDKFLKIYFNFNNTTNDILNVSKLADIKLVVKEGTLAPQKITDRQGNVYVQKILSHTQNFGILIFPATTSKNATLTFDQMYLEKDLTNSFQQKLELNLEELSKPTGVRK